MVAFVKELANTYKKTQLLKEALRHSWALNDIHYVCPDDKSGDTILHIAAKLGETKLVSQ